MHPAHAKQPVKLVLQITIDGLRGDLQDRYGKNFGEGGFRYLLKNGVVYTSAHFQHANTETIVGHATLATGAFPSEHGVIGNVWFDNETKELAYNIEDPNYPILPTRKEQTKGAQLDPAQKAARTQGRSPDAILAATFADVLSSFYAGKSKIFGVSAKDRGAVSMAGKVGKAFWYSTDSGDYVTSTYYYKEYPEWVVRWNAQRKAESYADKSWELLKKPSTYLLAAQDDRPYETDLKGYGRVFPHPYGRPGDKLFFTRIFVSPVGDQLTLDFSKQVLVNENLGKDEVPDYLSISFSSVDAINHFFGPSSLENEDIVLQLDRTLADLFSFIDKQVGLKNTLIVLSADHGMADMPEYMTSLGYKAGRLYTKEVVKIANQAGVKHFNTPDLVRQFYRPYLYLDHAKIKKAGLDPVLVEKTIARALTDIDGIFLAIPSSGLLPVERPPILKQVKRNFHVSRSGDIYLVQDPYWFLYNKGPIAVMHGSPWSYDTHVPLIFVGPGIKAKTISRTVHPVDVAPTLCSFLGMTPPSSAVGSPLREALE